ncbi:MAG TPA: radical SAM protein [Anaerolineales bacterium]|nr:radical SAM protein [Anaerolineales bacterium]
MFTKGARVDQDCACPSPFSEPEAGLAAHSSKPKRTLTAWLHLTEACNLDCAYCYALPTGRQMSAEIGQAAVRSLFNSAQQHGFDGLKIKYAGGEPSLRFDLALDLHSLAQRLAYETTLELDAVMLSNGASLTPAMLTKLQARGIRLSLSLDGLGADHDLQRPDRSGGGSFRRLQNTLDEIAKLAGPDGLQTSITITLTKLNLAGLPQTIRCLLARGLPFSLNFYRLSGRAEHPDLTPDPAELIQALRAAYAELESLPGAAQVLLPGLADRLRPDFAHARPCGVGETYIAIDPLGRPARCHMDLAHPAAQLPVEDPLAAVRAQPGGVQNPGVDDKPDCRACEWRYLCAGGCPLLAYRTTGSYGGRSPYCEVYRAVLPELMQLASIGA